MALQVNSGFMLACKLHSQVCGYGTQIPTRFSYKINLLTSSASGIFVVKFIFV
jgi:hypothetical protein